jgi:RES domain-containing protein
MTAEQPELMVIAGTFFRIVLEQDVNRVLEGAVSPQGRYHHDREPALYVSSRPEWAWKAVESYIQSNDPVRSVRQLQIEETRVVDIRNPDICRYLGIVPSDSDVPWQPQLAAGQRPSTWNVSDRARQAGADGLVYTARTAPTRWHLVLFRWNHLGGPTVNDGT